MSELQVRLGRAIGDRYSIQKEIGRGAIARVYLAEDRKHGRSVAIKVLHPDVGTGIATSRFDREIAIAAKLQHPHILPLHDSGHADGLVYFTMPYVEGDTLRSMIRAQGTLAIPDAIRIARQVASALSYAHARAIVHRDVKPANILISEGVPQVADFGTARAVLKAASDGLTETGFVIGSPRYMSPEQWEKNSTVDGRSDLYGLGCVLYEMLAGEPPYNGPTPHVIMARHALSPIPSLRDARPTVPERLEAAVRRALAKVPVDRHRTVAEFAAELAEIEAETRARGSAAARPARPTMMPGGDRPGILVLPFLNLSPREDEEYIATGLTDEIITSLSGLDALRVTSHTSAVQLKRTTKSARELGQELHVSYVLEGSVQRGGDALRIATRLVATETEDLIWGQSYEGLLADLFELEKRISRAVVEALEVRVSTAERRRLHEYRIVDNRAFEYYLRAKQEVYTFTGDALDRALEYLKKGAEITGDNIAIWAAMGYVYWQYINAGISADPMYFQRARECADRIMAIDPHSPEARRLLGLIEIHAKGNPQVAIDHLKAALAANANDPDTLLWLSLIYGCVGRSSSGYALAIRLLDVDPLTPLHHVIPGFLDVLDGDPERALPWLSRAHELDPANPIISIAYGQALAMAGTKDEACRVLDGIADSVPGSFFAEFGCAYSLALKGRHDEALAAITAGVMDNARHDLQYSWTLAQCYAMLGRIDEAVEWVGNAVRQGFWNYPLLTERDRLLAPLWSDSRYQQIMKDTKARWLGLQT